MAAKTVGGHREDEALVDHVEGLFDIISTFYLLVLSLFSKQ